MRKDRIEERLADLDRELKSLKSEHRQGTESIIMELKQFQEMMLEEKVAEIRNELSKGYLDIALDSYLDGINVKLGEGLPDPCPIGRRDLCKDAFRKRMDGAGQKLRDAGSNGLDEAALLVIRDDDAKLGHLKDSPTCGPCYQKYTNERERMAKMVEKLSTYKKNITTRAVDDYVRQLPDDMVISTVVSPLSHKARFRMMKSLSLGSMSYKELAEATGYEAGHLIYHLNKLMDAGLVAKSDSAGRYSITEKGIGVMDLVKTLYSR